MCYFADAPAISPPVPIPISILTVTTTLDLDIASLFRTIKYILCPIESLGYYQLPEPATPGRFNPILTL